MFLSIFSDELALDFPETLPILKSWGLSHVDLRGRVLGKHFEGLTPEDLSQVRKLIDEHGFKIGCLQSSLAKVHLPDKAGQQAEAQKLEAIIRAADALDCRLVRAFFYWQPDDSLKGELAVRPDLLQQVLDMFRPLADRMKQAGLVVGFENCGVTTDEVLTVLDALGEPTWGLAWDVTNGWFSSPAREKDETAYATALAKQSKMVHVKAKGSVPALGPTIPYDKVLQICDNAGLQGPVSVETHNPDRSISNVDQSRNVFDVIKAAWPTAAPGMVDKAEEKIEVTRDYEPVGFVVVGLGMGHSRAKQVHQTPGTKLIGVCDIDEARAKRTGEELGVPWKCDVREWLDNEDVEVVYVMTPTGRHAEVGLQALEAGKHVLTTKPMEASIQACDEMIQFAEARDLLLGVDFGMRFESNLLSLRAGLATRRLGRLLGGEVVLKVLRTMEYFNSNGGWRGTRRWDGGGVLSNQSIHHIDQMAFALGVPKRVKCEVRTLNHEIEAEDLGCAVWEYENGALVNVLCTTNYPHPTWYFRLELFGTDGAVALGGGGPLDKPMERWYVDGAWSDKAPETVKSPWLNAADNFADAIRTGAPLVCSGRDGRRTQSILDAMYRSAYGSRDWVDVKPELDN